MTEEEIITLMIWFSLGTVLLVFFVIGFSIRALGREIDKLHRINNNNTSIINSNIKILKCNIQELNGLNAIMKYTYSRMEDL